MGILIYHLQHFASSYNFEKNKFSVLCAVPCLGGSQIEVKMDKSAEIETKCRTDSSDFFTLWINLTYSLMHTPACMVSNKNTYYFFKYNFGGLGTDWLRDR